MVAPHGVKPYPSGSKPDMQSLHQGAIKAAAARIELAHLLSESNMRPLHQAAIYTVLV